MRRRALRLLFHRMAAVVALAGAVLALALPLAGAAAAADLGAWTIQNAPFRAVIRLQQPPAFPEAGVAIEVPEFGQTREDLRDVLLTDDEGRPLPIGVVWRGAGDRVLLLARALEAGKDYFLYFGGSRRMSEGWLPKIGLLMETRRLPPGTGFDSWEMLEAGWRRASEVDGVGFAPAIYSGRNPFGESVNFMTHYSGYLHTKGMSDIFLYTLSSDASFVLVDDIYQFGWPGRHSPRADAGTVPGKDVPCATEWTKIDYYQAKGGDGEPAMVLGRRRDGNLESIPAAAWLHPGTSTVAGIEEARGRPVPLATVKVHSYIGYGGQWYYDTECSLPPEGLWTVQWTFDDGATFTGNDCRRVIPGSAARMVTVSLTNGSEVIRGTRRIIFGGDMRRANVNDRDDLAWYVGLLKGETPLPFSGSLEADLLFLRDFGDVDTLGKFAGAWLKQNLNPTIPLWIDAEVAWLRFLAQSDPKRALAELHGLGAETRRDRAAWLDPLELELLVFYQHDAGAADRIKQIALENISSPTARMADVRLDNKPEMYAFLQYDSPLARMADVRLGDLYRLLGKYQEAADQYMAVQKTIADDSERRKLPAEDRAFSITITDFIKGGFRDEALRELEMWEFRHPMAKLDTDFLLLRARTLMLFGRWKEALAEIESFEKMETDSPYEIDAEFYRARLLYEMGQKEEARKIWREIAKDYPRNELAEPSKEWAAKP